MLAHNLKFFWRVLWRMTFVERAYAPHFWHTLASTAWHNPSTLKYMIFHIAFYLHLGPFAQFVIARLEREMDELDREPPVRHAGRAGAASQLAAAALLRFPEPFGDLTACYAAGWRHQHANVLVLVAPMDQSGAPTRMKITALIAAVAAFATLGVAAAQAEPGYSTANVNMRTGPDIEYPSVGVIPEGEPLYVEGCLQDESWCDVRWADNRGWVYSEYIGFDYHGQTAFCPTSASRRSAFPWWASSPPTTGGAGTGAVPGMPSTRVGRPSSGARASAGMLLLRVRAMQDGGGPAT